MLAIGSVLIRRIQIPDGGFVSNPVARPKGQKEQEEEYITFADALIKVSKEKTS